MKTNTLMLTQNFMTKYFNQLMNINTTNLVTKLIKFGLGILPLFLLLITFSCEEDPSSLGSDLLPDDVKLTYRYDTSMQFIASVNDNKPMNTTNLSHYNIGIHQDYYFGNLRGDYACQFYPSSYINKVENITEIDSVVLYLQVDSIYGLNDNSDLYFNIYELNTDIVMDSSYLSNIEVSDYFLEENPINTNSILSGDTLLKFNFNSTFTNKFISHGNDIYDSDTNFRDVFKGISIIPELINLPGGLVNFDASNSKFVLYYQTAEEDSLSTNFNLSYRFAKYTNDYSAGIAADYINNDPTENDSLIFVQGLNSMKSKIKFSNIDSWIDQDSTYSILNAELKIPVAEYDHNGFYPPENIFFYFSDADSTLIEVDDYSSPTLFNGTYNEENQEYSFNIPKHLMHILNGSIEDSCLNFTVYNKSFFPNRVILESGNNIKLNVTYTKH